jgi:hypothetical protein
MEMVSKKARKQKWKLFFSYFTVPKIALTFCLYAAVLLVGKFLTQDYYQGIFLFALGLAIFVFEIVHSIQTNKLIKSQKKAMIVTSERLSGMIHSGFFMHCMLEQLFKIQLYLQLIKLLIINSAWRI